MNRKVAFSALLVLSILWAGGLIPATANPRRPLSSILHINAISLQVYDLVLTTPARAFTWNFTVDLTGKDAGSDKFNLEVDASGVSPEGSVPLVLLFSDKNLTDWLSAPLTVHSGQEFAYAAFAMNTFASPPGSASTGSAITIDFVPPAGGSYHIAIMNPNAFANLLSGVQASVHIEIHGLETWTTTTIG